jgi:branched-chain amino acid transport system ATP-binding protein
MENKMIKIEVLNKNFGGLSAIKDLNLEIIEGEVVGLIGPNGAGKTTLFNLITGFIRPDSGLIKFKGENIVGFYPYKITKRGIARTFQIVRPFANMTVRENILVGMVSKVDYNIFNLLKDYSEIQKKRVTQILDLIGLQKRKDDLAANLPYAFRKRLEIGRALATEPKLLLLDEPSAGLNPKELNEQIEIIREINLQGITIIIIEHIMKVIMNISRKIIVLSYGKKIAEGIPKEVCKNKVVIDAYLGGTKVD